MTGAELERRINLIRSADTQRRAMLWYGLWRDLGISIGDGEVEDPVSLCRVLAVAELRASR